jgi:hypothetical protein
MDVCPNSAAQSPEWRDAILSCIGMVLLAAAFHLPGNSRISKGWQETPSESPHRSRQPEPKKKAPARLSCGGLNLTEVSGHRHVYRWRLRSLAKHAAEDRVHMLGVVAQVEGVVDGGLRQVLHHLGVGFQHGAEILAF